MVCKLQASVFGGINAADLTIEQAATLAGIVQMPEGYCPLVYPLSAQKRRDHVLFNMRKLGFISADLYEQAKKTTVKISNHDTRINAPHLKNKLYGYSLKNRWAKKRFMVAD